MKTLADFKRRCQPGVKLNFTFLPTGLTMPREVKQVRSADIIFLKEGKETYLTMPKSKNCEFPNDNTLIIYEEINNQRNPLLKYEFI